MACEAVAVRRQVDLELDVTVGGRVRLAAKNVELLDARRSGERMARGLRRRQCPALIGAHRQHAGLAGAWLLVVHRDVLEGGVLYLEGGERREVPGDDLEDRQLEVCVAGKRPKVHATVLRIGRLTGW